MPDKYGTGCDPGNFPGTDVLRNKLGIRNRERLAEADAEFAAIAADAIEITAPPFDLNYLCGIHRQLFDELYDWAGTIRTVDIAKGRTRFCTAERVIPEAKRLLDRLSEQSNFVGLQRPELVRCVAELYAELNLIHPFREGNGRALRLFFEHLILSCGFAVSWQDIEPQAWIDACVASVAGDYVPLKAIFERCIGCLLDPVVTG